MGQGGSDLRPSGLLATLTPLIAISVAGLPLSSRARRAVRRLIREDVGDCGFAWPAVALVISSPILLSAKRGRRDEALAWVAIGGAAWSAFFTLRSLLKELHAASARPEFPGRRLKSVPSISQEEVVLEATALTRVRRRSHRASYDRSDIDAILDSGVMCHIGYLVKPHAGSGTDTGAGASAGAGGDVVVTPTLYFRVGDRVYWHAAAVGRSAKSQLTPGTRVCFNVALLDGFVLSSAAATHSANYRSVTLFGEVEEVTDNQTKATLLETFLEHLYPGRSVEVRPPTSAELTGASLMSLAIREGAAKVRSGGLDSISDADARVRAWVGVLPVETVAGQPLPDDRMPTDIQLPQYLRPHHE